MFPYFIIFGKMFTTYLIFALVGIFIAGVFACRLARKRNLDDNDVIVVLLFSAIGVILGGHILYGLTNIQYISAIFTAKSFSQFYEYFTAIFGGSVFYGGLIGGLIAGFITIKAKKLPLSVYSDMLAVVIPLFHCFARVGCFLSGCCYGIECEWGITVSGNTLVPDINGVPRFPVQLLEAFLNLILFFVLHYLYKKSFTKEFLQGKILLIYLLSYSVIRFFDEFLRGDEIRGFIFGLSTSQFISLILFVVSTLALMILSIKRKKGKK